MTLLYTIPQMSLDTPNTHSQRTASDSDRRTQHVLPPILFLIFIPFLFCQIIISTERLIEIVEKLP